MASGLSRIKFSEAIVNRSNSVKYGSLNINLDIFTLTFAGALVQDNLSLWARISPNLQEKIPHSGSVYHLEREVQLCP